MNHDYEILTEEGFRDFLTVSIKTVSEFNRIYFSNDTILECTPSHLIKVSDEFIEAANLKIGDIVSPNNLMIEYIERIVEPVEVFDAVNVSGGNHYITNNVTSHNCVFLTEELTLIDSDAVTRAEQLVQMKIEVDELIAFAVNDNKFQFFKRLERNMIYLVGVDPSTGSGKDGGVIQVYEFPSMEQVLEYTTTTLSPHVLYTELKSLLNFLQTISDEIYFSVENNGVGQGVLAAYEGDMSPPLAALVSEPGKTGVNSNTKTKLRACLQFKALMERGKVTINSPQLLSELKSFIRHSGSYAAQVGATDDRIMATIVVFYIIQQLSERNGEAYDIVYSVASDIEARHGWIAEVKEEDVMPTSERSEELKKYFDSMHDTSTVRGGIFL